MDINTVMQYVTFGMALLGVLAFMVSIVVQVIKEMPFLAKIPTSAVALITSMVLCPVALVVLCTYFKITITWYYVFASFYGCFYCLFSINWRMGKDQRDLGQDKVQGFGGRVIVLFLNRR